LPWLTDELPNGELLVAMYNVGMLARWPGSWPQWSPVEGVTEFFSDPAVQRTTPIYCVVTEHFNDAPVVEWLDRIDRQCATKQEFLDKLNRFVLFPKPKERVNENSRSAKDRRSLI
jgi:hypothetical protein